MSEWKSVYHLTNEIFLTHGKTLLFSLGYALYHFTENSENIIIGHDSEKKPTNCNFHHMPVLNIPFAWANSPPKSWISLITHSLRMISGLYSQR